MSLKKTFRSLKQQLETIRREQGLDDLRSQAFPFWFCQAQLADPENITDIRRALIGQARDHNVDILYVSHDARTVYICQTKLRDELMRTGEKPNDVRAIAQLAADFALPKNQFLERFKDASGEVKQRLADAHDLVRHDFSLHAYYVTTGKVSRSVQEEAENTVHRVQIQGGRALDVNFSVFDGRDCCRLQVDFEDLVPAIPHIEFRGVEHVKIAAASGPLYSYVFAVPVHQIASVFEQHKERLFARNIRLSRGEHTSTNREILKSLRNYPSEFYFLNNGITILGSRAEPKGDDKLRISNPQIINGQQTTRMIALAESGKTITANVLVKVIVYSADTDQAFENLRQFVYRVVRATNFQNRVKLSELAANGREHIRLERALKSLGWEYRRKAGRSESKHQTAFAGLDKPFGHVTLQQLTTAVVACLHDPQYMRETGIEEIFEELFEESKDSLYRRIFPEDCLDARQYLFCVLCLRFASVFKRSRGGLAGTVDRHGRYYVAALMFELLLPIFDLSPLRMRLLVRIGSRSRGKKPYGRSLVALRRNLYDTWSSFFRTKGDGDIRAFVGKQATKDAWRAFFHNSPKATKARHFCSEAVLELEAELRAAAEEE